MKRVRDPLYIVAFGSRLRELRTGRELSMEQLGHLAQIPLSQVARIELGKINPSISTAKALADALGITVAELMTF